MLRAAVRGLMLWALYASLLVWHTWPLAARSTTHLAEMAPGSGFDALYSAWVLAWQSHALTTGGVAVAMANIYHPTPDALYYGPVAFGALPFFAPTFLVTGNPTLALNVLLLGGIALSAAAIHFVVTRWTGWQSAGLVAGVSFAANRWLLVTFVPRTPHIAVLCYFPLIIALAARPRLTTRGALLLCALVVAQGLTDAAYVAPAAILPLAGVAVVLLTRPGSRPRGVRILGAVAAATLILAIVYAPYRAVAERNPELFQQTLWKAEPERVVLQLPGDLMGAVTPLAIATLVPLMILIAGVVVALRSWRGSTAEASAWRHALWWTAAGIVISLPLSVGWQGRIYRLPHLDVLRAHESLARILANPDRLRVAALCGIALLSGLAFAELLRHARCGGEDLGARCGRGVAALVICAAVYVQFAWAIGQPVSYWPASFTRMTLTETPRDSPVLRELRRRGGPTVEVPVPPQDSPLFETTAMFRSIFHWQPLLNGYGSFWPAGFEERMRLAARLPDPEALRALQHDAGLEFVLVRTGQDPRVEAQRLAWLEVAARGTRSDLTLVASDDDLLLFRASGRPAQLTDRTR